MNSKTAEKFGLRFRFFLERLSHKLKSMSKGIMGKYMID